MIGGAVKPCLPFCTLLRCRTSSSAAHAKLVFPPLIPLLDRLRYAGARSFLYSSTYRRPAFLDTPLPEP